MSFTVWREPEWVRTVHEAPWEIARALAERFSSGVAMLERQPIRAIEGGRSFAANDGPAPLHTDSQLFRGRPAHLQVLFCVREASAGGTSLVVDALERVRDLADRALEDSLFRVRRSFPFVFGDFEASTIAAVGEDVFFTHSPRPDPLGSAIERHLGRPTTIDLRSGDVLVVDNHRCVHGRTAFADRTRELQRLLIWLTEPPRRDPALLERALREGTAPRRTGIPPAIAAIEPSLRASLVSDMRRGVPPGVLSHRHRIPESFLYVFRDEISA